VSLPEVDIAWLGWVFESIQGEAFLEELSEIYHCVLNLTSEFGLGVFLEFSSLEVVIKVKHEGVVIPQQTVGNLAAGAVVLDIALHVLEAALE